MLFGPIFKSNNTETRWINKKQKEPEYGLIFHPVHFQQSTLTTHCESSKETK